MDEALHRRLSAALGGAYTLGSLLGTGGMGAVYRATDHRLRRDVAVKVLPPELVDSSEHRSRFVREAQTAAGLAHPHIVPIFDVGERDGLAWFVMALVEGESLAANVERLGARPLSATLRMLQEVGQALGYAHARGVVHRDVKPENILIDAESGRCQITDFGIAKLVSERDARLTAHGTLLGTARNMAPEQLLGDAPVDGRADLYSLALVGIYMLTGAHPIKATALPEIVAAHLRGSPVDLRALEGKAPERLVRALERCLAARPEERCPRAEDFLATLRELGAAAPEIPAPVRTFFRETERLFVMAGILMVATGVVGTERVPPALLIATASIALYPWVYAVEALSRKRIGWPAIRRGLHLERARRMEEFSESRFIRSVPLASFASFSLLLVAFGLLTDVDFDHGVSVRIKVGERGIDQALLLLGGACTIIGAPHLWFQHGVRRRVSKQRWILMWMGSGMLLSAMVLAVIARNEALPPWSVPFVLFVMLALTGPIVLLVAFLWSRWARGPSSPGREWQVPRWMDLAGSLLFGRFGRRGWGIGFERDRPAPRLPYAEAAPSAPAPEDLERQ